MRQRPRPGYGCHYGLGSSLHRSNRSTPPTPSATPSAFATLSTRSPAYNKKRTPKPVAPARKPRQGSRSLRDGLRPVRILLPDFDSRTFRDDAHRQSHTVATSPGEKENQDFIDVISGPD
jgi:hypothetical protein